jgi:hypothetical protein
VQTQDASFEALGQLYSGLSGLLMWWELKRGLKHSAEPGAVCCIDAGCQVGAGCGVLISH